MYGLNFWVRCVSENSSIFVNPGLPKYKLYLCISVFVVLYYCIEQFDTLEPTIYQAKTPGAQFARAQFAGAQFATPTFSRGLVFRGSICRHFLDQRYELWQIVFGSLRALPPWPPLLPLLEHTTQWKREREGGQLSWGEKRILDRIRTARTTHCVEHRDRVRHRIQILSKVKFNILNIHIGGKDWPKWTLFKFLCYDPITDYWAKTLFSFCEKYLQPVKLLFGFFQRNGKN